MTSFSICSWLFCESVVGFVLFLDCFQGANMQPHTGEQISLRTLFALLVQTFKLHLGAISLPLNED